MDEKKDLHPFARAAAQALISDEDLLRVTKKVFEKATGILAEFAQDAGPLVAAEDIGIPLTIFALSGHVEGEKPILYQRILAFSEHPGDTGVLLPILHNYGGAFAAEVERPIAAFFLAVTGGVRTIRKSDGEELEPGRALLVAGAGIDMRLVMIHAPMYNGGILGETVEPNEVKYCTGAEFEEEHPLLHSFLCGFLEAVTQGRWGGTPRPPGARRPINN